MGDFINGLIDNGQIGGTGLFVLVANWALLGGHGGGYFLGVLLLVLWCIAAVVE